jgi:hypothetical protein
MATTSAAAPARSRNHSGVAVPPPRMDPARASAMGPTTANPTSPASTSRTSPKRIPSSRRASNANPPTIATTLSTISTAVRAMVSTLTGDQPPGEPAPEPPHSHRPPCPSPRCY